MLPFTSASLADTVAVLVLGPAAAVSSTVYVTTIVTAALPAARVPTAHVTTPPPTVHVPTVDVAPVTVTPAGIVCTTTTFVAVFVPTFSTTVVYARTTPSPAVIDVALLGSVKLVTRMSTVTAPAADTTVVADPSLFANVASPTVVLAVAFVTRLTAVGPAGAVTVAVTVYVVVAPAPTVPSPHGSAPQLALTSVSPAGSDTVDATFCAAVGPAFVTSTVSTTVLPDVVGVYPAFVTVTARSASPIAVVSVATLLPWFLSLVVVLFTRAVLLTVPAPVVTGTVYVVDTVTVCPAASTPIVHSTGPLAVPAKHATPTPPAVVVVPLLSPAGHV